MDGGLGLKRRRWTCGALLLGAVIAAPAIADRATGKSAAASTPQTCGEKLAGAAPLFDKSADVLSKGADVWTAHAQWIGNSQTAKAEHDELSKVASSYRDAAQQLRKLSQELASAHDLQSATHKLDSPEAARVGALMKEQAKTEKELAGLLQKHAAQTERAASDMGAAGVGGSGATDAQRIHSNEFDQFEPPSSEMMPPDRR